MLCLLLLVGVPRHFNGWRDENSSAREGFGKFRLIPAFPEHPGIGRDNMEAEDGGAAEPGKLNHAGFSHETWAARSIRSDGGLQALAQSPDHFHQDAGSSTATGPARRCVTVPMND